MHSLSTEAIPSIAPAPLFAKRLKNQLNTLKKEITGLNIKSSRKEIHDLRVSCRRLESKSIVLKINSLERFSKELIRALGPIRSLDVCQRDLKNRFKNKSGKEKELLSLIIPWIKNKRKKLQKALLREVKKEKKITLLEKIALEDLKKSVPLKDLEPVLEKELQQGWALVLKNWALFEEKEKISALHEVRISLKKFRYLVEVKEECTPASKSSVPEIKAIQDRLGLIHDAEVLRDLLKDSKIKRFARKTKTRKDLKRLRTELKLEIKKKMENFHQTGEKALQEISNPEQALKAS